MSLIGRCNSWTALKMGHCNEGRRLSRRQATAQTAQKSQIESWLLSFICWQHTRWIPKKSDMIALFGERSEIFFLLDI